MAEALNVLPSICVYPDEKCENLQIEIVLPGVEKKDISLKISENSFYVNASKEGVNYKDSYFIACPIIPEKTVATYSNGILKVTVPYREPLKGVVDVKI